MIESFEKRLDFDSDTFEGMKRDMNFVLQRLIGNMKEKESNEGMKKCVKAPSLKEIEKVKKANRR